GSTNDGRARYARFSWLDSHRIPRIRVVRSKGDRKSTRLNSSHVSTSYAVFGLKKKENTREAWRKTVRCSSLTGAGPTGTGTSRMLAGYWIAWPRDSGWRQTTSRDRRAGGSRRR